MRNERYTPCHVKIPRNISLDKLALSKPGRRIQRCQSMPRNKPVSPEASTSQSNPVINMQKVRSILKNPIDKPRGLLARRKSMTARVEFTQPEIRFFDVEAEADNNTTQNDEETVNVVSTSDEPLIDFADIETNHDTSIVQPSYVMGNLIEPTIATQSDSNSQSSEVNDQNDILIDEFDPLSSPTTQNATNDSSNAENSLRSLDWSLFQTPIPNASTAFS